MFLLFGENVHSRKMNHLPEFFLPVWCKWPKIFGRTPNRFFGALDAKLYRKTPELAFVQDSPDMSDDILVPDTELHDGDVLTFGNTTITCYEVPGHTPGCVALFFDAYDGDEKKRCGYYGGFGFNTLTVEELREAGDPECTMWKTYEESLLKVIDQKVDIFLGNHTENNKTLEKREMIKNGASSNPFIDPDEWHAYLAQKQQELHAFIAAQKK